MKQYFLGVLLLFLITSILHGIHKLYSPLTHFNMLEWWGLVSLGLVVMSGYNTYREDDS